MHAAKYIYVFRSYTNLDTPPHHTPIQTWLRQDLDDGLGGSLTTPVLPLGVPAKGLPPLSPLIGASPSFHEISRRFRNWMHFGCIDETTAKIREQEAPGHLCMVVSSTPKPRFARYNPSNSVQLNKYLLRA
jgi:hypothetical protein